MRSEQLLGDAGLASLHADMAVGHSPRGCGAAHGSCTHAAVELDLVFSSHGAQWSFS